MPETLTVVATWLLKAGAVLLAANEIRGFLLAGPVLYAMYEAGGTAMAIWLGFCSLAGIALSVIVPLVIASKLQLRLSKQRRFAARMAAAHGRSPQGAELSA